MAWPGRGTVGRRGGHRPRRRELGLTDRGRGLNDGNDAVIEIDQPKMSAGLLIAVRAGARIQGMRGRDTDP